MIWKIDSSFRSDVAVKFDPDLRGRVLYWLILLAKHLFMQGFGYFIAHYS